MLRLWYLYGEDVHSMCVSRKRTNKMDMEHDELEVGYAVLDVIGEEAGELMTKVLFDDEIKLLVNVEDELAGQ